LKAIALSENIRAKLAVRVQRGVTRSGTGPNVSLANDFELVLALSLELPDTVRAEVTDVEIAVL